MSWTFNPPPGWPEQPAGWEPPPGWTPDPSWPPPPAGWQFWVTADQPAAAAPPAPAPTSPYPAQQPHQAQPGYSGQQPHQAQPGYPAQQPYQGPPGYQGYQGYQAGPSQSGSAGKLWFAQWWGVLGLAGALIVGGLLGFGGTNLGLSMSAEDEPVATDTGAPSPEASEPPELSLPSVPPIPTQPPDSADLTEVCGEVAVIMLVMVGEQMSASDADDPRAALAESRRTAATSLRDVDGANDTERDALATFADDLDDAADYLEQGAFTERRLDEFLERSSGAWNDFNETAGC